MTDFSPVEGALITLLVLVGDVARGSGIFGPADELRVNMKAPYEIDEDRTNGKVNTEGWWNYVGSEH
jgi:hypothetical protein